MIALNDYGIKTTDESSNNKIYHNDFNNLHNADDSYINQWDNSYPSGGNYWNDYRGVDHNHGENQDIPGPDGIGDTSYNITGGSNQDLYPSIYLYNGIPGDMNFDVNLNSADVRYLALNICGDPAYSPLYAPGDVNSDGYINSADVRYLALYIVGDPDYSPLYP